ncbi:MAG: response regulator transcription factor [Anaerolineaceae bacterium]|nr:response regulator transcription factor [Anaerolineaceae bacterium]
MDRILAIDDDPQIQKLVTLNLQARGYAVQVASSGEETMNLFRIGKFDLILLDLILPGMSGIDVCLWIRQQSDVPILVLSAREDEELKVRALDAGADDYVTKPFSQEEMMARVRAVLRRSQGNAAAKGSEIHIKDLTINIQAHRAFVNGQDMHLTRTEFAILVEMAQNQESILTHENLLARVWGPEYRDSSHYLHIYLGRIRKKLGVEMEPLLETVPGVGYILHSAV